MGRCTMDQVGKSKLLEIWPSIFRRFLSKLRLAIAKGISEE